MSNIQLFLYRAMVDKDAQVLKGLKGFHSPLQLV